MSGWVYILQCSDDTFYTGSTSNLERRLYQHQNGEGANYTKKRLPVKLVFCEEFERVDEAFYREKQVQGWNRKKKQALIEKNYEKLPELAKCQNESHFENKSTSPFDSAQGPVTNVLDSKKEFLKVPRRSSLSGVEGHGKISTKYINKEKS